MEFSFLILSIIIYLSFGLICITWITGFGLLYCVIFIIIASKIITNMIIWWILFIIGLIKVADVIEKGNVFLVNKFCRIFLKH